MPVKIFIFKWCCRETTFFPWKGKTSRDLARDLQYSLNSGQDLSSLWMSILRPVLGMLGTEEVKDITSVRVSQETSLKFPMNNLFSLTTDCQSIIYRTWSSVPVSSFTLVPLWTSATLPAIKPVKKGNKPMGVIFPCFSKACTQLSKYYIKYHRYWSSFSNTRYLGP